MINLKSDREMAYLRDAGRLTALTHKELAKAIKPGVTTQELDRLAEEFIRKQGGVPAFKGYQGYPANICTSINDEVVHGIPGLRKLNSGDIISVDIGTLINGFYGDAAVTHPVGDVEPEALRLIKATEEALEQGIAAAISGNRLTDISHSIQTYVENNGFSVVRDYVGHGIGSRMHEDPPVPNFGKPGRGPRLQPGMTLAVEPMVNAGTYEVMTKEDRWTVVTKDGQLSAHFEHTIAITDGRPEVLTRL